jgi:hypothetical protein
MFCLSPVYIDAPSKFRQVSDKAPGKFLFFLSISFPVKLVGLSCVGCWLLVIDVSDEPCFAARTDPML